MAYPSNEPDDDEPSAYSITAGELRAFVERIETLAGEQEQIREHIKDVYADAKGRGYDVKVLRDLIARRRKDRSALEEHEAIRSLYEEALGF